MINRLIKRLIKTQLHARQLDGASKRRAISRQAAWAGANTYCSARNTIIQNSISELRLAAGDVVKKQ